MQGVWGVVSDARRFIRIAASSANFCDYEPQDFQYTISPSVSMSICVGLPGPVELFSLDTISS